MFMIQESLVVTLNSPVLEPYEKQDILKVRRESPMSSIFERLLKYLKDGTTWLF